MQDSVRTGKKPTRLLMNIGYRLRAVQTLSALLLVALCRVAGADPTLLGDAYVSTGAPRGNFGDAVTLSVSSIDTTYLRFYLPSGLPTGVTGSDVAKATLKLYVNLLTTAGTMTLHQASSLWNERTITATNAPLPGPQVGSRPITLNEEGRWIVVDVTELIQTWLDTPTVPSSVALVSTLGLSMRLDSKENSATSHEPIIEINLKGSTGAKGATGATGATGARGATGVAGTTGATGARGATGATGARGATGVAGTTGATGAAGTNGINGATGATGPTGANGATGATGTAGATGVAGATGATGLTFQGAWSNLTTYGATATVSFAGSSYISLQGSNLNQPPNSSPAFWSLLAQGVTGATGATGAAGTTGATGAAGAAGSTGATGAAGANGATGATGAAGANGATGATGAAGATGTTGTAGAAGATGSNGGYLLSFAAAESSFTPSTQVFNFQTNTRNQITTLGTLNALSNMVYTAFGCTLTELSVNASANATDNEVFTVVTSSGFSLTYSDTSATCTMSTGTSSCSFTGSIAIAANSRLGVSQTIPTGTPAGWNVAGSVICK